MHYKDHPIPKGAIIGGETQRESDIPASLHELEKSISILQDELSILYGKLHPIMRNEASSKEECCPEELNRCELSGIIRSSAIRITSINNDIRKVVGLLEI